MSTLAISTFPSCLATIFSNLGPRILQGPHHLMRKERAHERSHVQQQQPWKVCWYATAFNAIAVPFESQPGNNSQNTAQEKVSLTKELSKGFSSLCVWVVVWG